MVDEEAWLTDEQVADGQRCDEVVGRLTYRPLQHERQYHNQVAADRHDARQHRQQSQRPGPPRRPAADRQRRVVVIHGRRWRRHREAVIFGETHHQSWINRDSELQPPRCYYGNSDELHSLELRLRFTASPRESFLYTEPGSSR